MVSTDFYNAFSNKVRIGLISCLEKEKTVTELINTCNLSQSAVSQHLAKLRKANIVSTKRQGKQIYPEPRSAHNRWPSGHP